MNNSILPPQYHSYICRPLLYPCPRAYGFGIVAKVPRHPRGGTGRLPWAPPRPPTSAVHTRQLSLFSMCYVHAHLALTARLACHWFTNVDNSYIPQSCHRHNTVEYLLNATEAVHRHSTLNDDSTSARISKDKYW